MGLVFTPLKNVISGPTVPMVEAMNLIAPAICPSDSYATTNIVFCRAKDAMVVLIVMIGLMKKDVDAMTLINFIVCKVENVLQVTKNVMGELIVSMGQMSLRKIAPVVIDKKDQRVALWYLVENLGKLMQNLKHISEMLSKYNVCMYYSILNL